MQKITPLRYRVLPRLPGADPGIFITEGGGGGGGVGGCSKLWFRKCCCIFLW